MIEESLKITFFPEYLYPPLPMELFKMKVFNSFFSSPGISDELLEESLPSLSSVSPSLC